MYAWKGLYIGVYTSEKCINTMGVFNAKLGLGVLWPVCIVGVVCLFVFKLLFQLAGSMLADVCSQQLHVSDGPEL